jgi:hypothetical protein
MTESPIKRYQRILAGGKGRVTLRRVADDGPPPQGNDSEMDAVFVTRTSDPAALASAKKTSP